MTLQAWRESGLIDAHRATPQEVSDLLAVVETDLRDAAIPELSPERRLGCYYRAILTAARAALRASGYRASESTGSRHYYVIQSLRYTVGLSPSAVLQIEAIQKKCNTADYVRIGELSGELVTEAKALAEQVTQSIRDWLAERHPELLSG